MNQAEREFLKQAVREVFENPTGTKNNPLLKRKLIANQNKANYESLAQEVSKIAEEHATQALKERVRVNSFVISAHQLRSLFTEPEHGFRDYFVEACYLYTQGMERQTFIENPKNAALVSSWIQEIKDELPPQYVGEIADLKNENEALKQVEKKLTEQLAEHKNKLAIEQADNDNRRRWIQNAKKIAGIAAIFLLIGTLLYAYKESRKPTVWVMSSPWDGESSYRSKLIANIVKRVYDETHGQFIIQVFHNGYLPNSTGKPVEKLSDLFTAVSNGDIQMAHYSPYYSFNIRPADVFFCSMPGGMKHEEMDRWLREDGGQELWQRLYKPYRVLPFSCGHTGEQMGGWFKKEIQKIDDFRGLKFRIGSPIGASVLASFGAVIDTQKIGEWQIVRKMATDQLQAAEFIGPSDDYTLGMAGIRGFNYYYKSHWHEPNTMNAMIINQGAFSKLTENFQRTLVAAIEKFGGEMFGNMKSQNEVQEKFIRDNLPEIHLVPFPTDVENALNLRASEKVNEFVDKNRQDTLFMTIYHSYKKNCANCSGWRN